MKKIKQGFILPSAAFTLKGQSIKYYNEFIGRDPKIGDVVYGEVDSTGQHSSLENCNGRIHHIFNGTRAVFVYGNRYAPDYYEGLIPKMFEHRVDLLARSGMIGNVVEKNSMKKDPTVVKILGYVCGKDGNILNTTKFSRIKPNGFNKKEPRSKLILCIGTSMNSGKSMAAASCCYTLSTTGHNVRASKITGTASLKDILRMNDMGAFPYTDFTHLGYPSTYLLEQEDLLKIFNYTDLKYANNPKNYWVVELADGILQRETAMLLSEECVRMRIYKLIFCSTDAFAMIGGLQVLKDKFRLTPDALSGVCSSSPLHIRELNGFTNIPVFNSASIDLKLMSSILFS